jgi:parallel beta-helix repeat protein
MARREQRMTKKTFLVLVLVAGSFLVACGGSEPDPGAQATQIAAGVAATIAAQQAPPPQTVIVVTPPPPTEPPATSTVEPTVGVDLLDLHLNADGSGDLPTLEEALVQSEVGATITLGPGTYRLDRALTVAGSLHLVGAGRDQTEIISAEPDWVLRFQGDGPFTAEGITFRHEGDTPADVVAVASGQVDFQNCRFTGGVFSAETGIGSGLFLEDSVTGQVYTCETGGNGLHGILVRGDAQPTLEGNTCRDNGDSGIVYFDQAGGVARDNDCSANAMHGIYLGDEAAPTLAGNTLRDNGDSGIAYFGRAGGTARGNICSGNAYHDIYAAENAAPFLAENQCTLAGSAAGKIGFGSDRDGGDMEIYVMNADGSGITRLTDTPGTDHEPDGSPDGARIAFTSERDGNSEIYVMNADGSGQTNLTNNPAYDSSPAWSPDSAPGGGRIAFDSNREGNSEIYVMNADGSGLINLTNNSANDASPAWSPDGKQIVFSSDRDGNSEIYVMNADGSGQTNLSNNPASDFFPSWSPDGNYIAFTTDRDRSGQIYLMAVPGGTGAAGSSLTALTDHPAGNGAPDWSPDGTHLVFTSYRDGPGEIYTIKADGTELTNLTDDPATDAGWPAWWGLGVPFGAPSSGVVPQAANAPRFNPAGDPWCLNMPDSVVGGDWQVVAPREVTFPGDPAEIGLRNNAGQAGSEYPVTVRVIVPDESEATASATLVADQWVQLVYPDDFAGGDTSQRGAYTVLWELESNLIACDGFLVGGGAGQ